MTDDNPTLAHEDTGLQRRQLLRLATLPGGVAAAVVLPLEAAAQAGPVPMWVPAEMPPPAPQNEGVADLPGTRLWYWDTGGSGPAVVFMHAGTQSGAGWGYQQPVFAAAGFRTIGYSRRGYFRSDPGDPANPGLGSEDLKHLLDYLKVKRAHLVALAHGGFFALDFALVYPQRVRSLTIASSYMGIDASEKDYAEANARLRPKPFEALPSEVKELHPSYRAGNPEGLVAWVKLEHEAANGPRVNPKRAHVLTWATLESIRLPTLLMTGDGDLYTPPALLRMQASHMPHAELTVITEAGHCANWEQPAAFNERVLTFLCQQAAT
jgi:pimeloyl-ACP methyl ester carboxylesterase